MKYNTAATEAILDFIARRQERLTAAIAAATSAAQIAVLTRRHLRLSALHGFLVDAAILIRDGGAPTGEPPLSATLHLA